MKKLVKSFALLTVIAVILSVGTVCYGAEPNFSDNLMFYYNFDGAEELENSGELSGDAFLTVGDWYMPDDAEFNGTVDSMEGYGKAAKLVAGDPATTSWIQLPERMLAQFEDEFTISFWYMGTENTPEGSMPLHFCGLGIEFYMCFEVKNGRMCVFSTPEGDAENRNYLEKNEVSIVGWHMYTLTCIKGEEADKFEFYVDGVLVETADSYKMYDAYALNSMDGNKKDYFNGLGRGYWDWPMSDGAIDEIRAYDVALSAENISELYTTPFVEEVVTEAPSQTPEQTEKTVDPTENIQETSENISQTPGEESENSGDLWIIVTVVILTVAIVVCGIIIINKKSKK